MRVADQERIDELEEQLEEALDEAEQEQARERDRAGVPQKSKRWLTESGWRRMPKRGVTASRANQAQAIERGAPIRRLR